MSAEHLTELPDIVHTTTVRVRYADTDQMGVVYYAAYLLYFESGRTELLRACGIPYTELEARGYALPVVEAHLRYHAPAHYDDILEVHTRYRPRYAPTVLLEYEVRRQDELIVTGSTLHIFVEIRSRRPVRPPAIFWNAVRQYALCRERV